MLSSRRFTRSGACASCGKYPGYRCNSPLCQSEEIRSYPHDRCDLDGYLTKADPDLASLDDEDQWMRLWYGPRIQHSQHVW